MASGALANGGHVSGPRRRFGARGRGFLTISDEDLASACMARKPRFDVTPQSCACRVLVFEELGLVRTYAACRLRVLGAHGARVYGRKQGGAHRQRAVSRRHGRHGGIRPFQGMGACAAPSRRCAGASCGPFRRTNRKGEAYGWSEQRPRNHRVAGGSPELADAIGALSIDTFDGGIAPSAE